jgi:hypothetical protein
VGKAAVGAVERLKSTSAASERAGNLAVPLLKIANLPSQKEISRLSIRHGTAGYRAIFQSQ